MADESKVILRHFVHKVLVRRLIIVTLLVAAVAVFGTYLMERNRLLSDIRERALNRILPFNESILSTGDVDSTDEGSVFQPALSTLFENRVRTKDGEFVYLEIYDVDGQIQAQASEARYKHIERMESSLNSRRSFPARDDPYVHIFRIAGIPHVQVALPLVDRNGETFSYISGVYAVSQYAVDRFRAQLERILIAMAIVVLSTTIILYSVILRLVSKLSVYSEHLLNSNLQTLKTLGSAIAKRDSDTDVHNYRVTLYSIFLAKRIGLDDKSLRKLIKGSFLHDAGKIAVRDNILLKPGRLDDDEFEIMKTHVEHGVDIVHSAEWLRDGGAVVAGHHEKVDGSGYPKGLKGRDIPLEARIFAIADVFDALTSKRPYKEPYPYEKAMDILREGSGTHFDAELLTAFMSISEELYDHYSGREDDGLKRELNELTLHYFKQECSEIFY